MKKVLISAVAGMLGLLFMGVSALADTTSTYTNVFGQVVTVVTTSQGVKTTTVTMPSSSVVTPVRVTANLVGIQVSTNTTVTTTAYTPRDVGDILIGTAAGTVHVATGVATSSWKTVAMAAQVDEVTNTTITAYTPRYKGDILVGIRGGGTNTAWIAVGATTNDWVLVGP